MSDVILGAWHGGLGDNIQFSTLPEEFYKQQGRETYLKDGSSFRNEGIYELIWKHNPYIKGIKEGEWNAGDIPEIEYSNVAGTCIANWEKLHGLQPTNKYPKIYYKPKVSLEYSGVYLVDFTCISIDYDMGKLINKLKQLQSEYSDMKFVEVTFSEDLSGDDGKYNQYDMNLEKLVINNIFDYYDIICSCSGLVALSSGASHMSSAAKEHNKSLNSICIMEESWYNYHVNKGNLFIFDNIDYQVI